MNRKGFTLIELMVVIVIVGILTTVGVPKYTNSKAKAYATAMKSDLRNLLNAQENFFADSSHYTANLVSLGFTPSTGVNPPVITVSAGSWSAINTHTQLASTQCAIGVNTANPLVVVSGEAEPACK
jgi:type IV pilus assembly protein PilA